MSMPFATWRLAPPWYRIESVYIHKMCIYTSDTCTQFPHADKDAVLKKVAGRAKDHISTLETAFKEQDPSNTGSLGLQQFT